MNAAKLLIYHNLSTAQYSHHDITSANNRRTQLHRVTATLTSLAKNTLECHAARYTYLNE